MQIPLRNLAANPGFCTDPSDLNLTQSLLLEDLIPCGILYPQCLPIIGESSSCPSRNSR